MILREHIRRTYRNCDILEMIIVGLQTYGWRETSATGTAAGENPVTSNEKDSHMVTTREQSENHIVHQSNNIRIRKVNIYFFY